MVGWVGGCDPTWLVPCPATAPAGPAGPAGPALPPCPAPPRRPRSSRSDGQRTERAGGGDRAQDVVAKGVLLGEGGVVAVQGRIQLCLDLLVLKPTQGQALRLGGDVHGWAMMGQRGGPRLLVSTRGAHVRRRRAGP